MRTKFKNFLNEKYYLENQSSLEDDDVIYFPENQRIEIFQWLKDNGYEWNIGDFYNILISPKDNSATFAGQTIVIRCLKDKKIYWSDNLDRYKPTITFEEFPDNESEPEIVL